MSRPLVRSVFLFLLAASTSTYALEGDDVSTWSFSYGELSVLSEGFCDDYFFVNKQAAEAAQFEYYAPSLIGWVSSGPERSSLRT